MSKLWIILLICIAPSFAFGCNYSLLTSVDGMDLEKIEGVTYLVENIGNHGAWQTIKDYHPIKVVDKVVINDTLELFVDSWHGTFKANECVNNVKFYKCSSVPIPSSMFLLLSGLFLIRWKHED